MAEMNYLLFQLKRILLAPGAAFSTSNRVVGSLWGDRTRGRAFLFGLPAILFAVVGVALLLWAKYGIASSLENRYKVEKDNSRKEKARISRELKTEARMLQASVTPGSATPTTLDELIPKDDPRRVELEEWKSKEMIYLEKLIELNPNEPEYLFQLALASFGQGTPGRGIALIKMTAPLDEPGYVQGHLWLADYYMKTRPKTKADALRNIEYALTHVNQCLKRDTENLVAKTVKARLLYAQNDLVGAYEIFDELFQNDVRYFRSLVEINQQLKMEERNNTILDYAIIRLQQQLKDLAINDVDRVRVWNDLVSCFLDKSDFSAAEQGLLEEIQLQSESDANSGKSVWAERMLATIYLNSIATIAANDPDALTKRIAFLKSAFKYDKTNSTVKRELTRLANNENPDVANAAIAIYDVAVDQDAPASVLTEVGSQALLRSDYDRALRHFELARKKTPKSPEVLNNLAFTYTVIEPPNPKRALKLIDEAIRYLPKNKSAKKYLSFFHDTRGQALMQLERWTDATAEFEFALLDRQNNRKILMSLVKCYEASGLDPSAYEQRLKEIDADSASDENANSE